MGEGTQQAASSAGNALTEGTCVSYFPVAVIQQTRNKQPLKARRSCLGSPFMGFQLAAAKKARLLGWLAVVGGACSWFVGGGNQEAESAVQNQSQISPSGFTPVTTASRVTAPRAGQTPGAAAPAGGPALRHSCRRHFLFGPH